MASRACSPVVLQLCAYATLDTASDAVYDAALTSKDSLHQLFASVRGVTYSSLQASQFCRTDAMRRYGQAVTGFDLTASWICRLC